MAPIRRYLRISKYSVLECRIYLDNPSDTRWLLDSRDPVLPRIFAAIRPLVLPKLREENERMYAKKKGKPVKDVFAEGMALQWFRMRMLICVDEFEVAIFLRESRTRHSLLTRQKTFQEPDDTHTKTGTADAPTGGTAQSGILVESDSEDTDLHNIPEAASDGEEGAQSDNSQENRPIKRRKGKEPSRPRDPDTDDKKLGFRTNYESFNIYGWVLCLLVTRKGERAKAPAPSEPPRQALMEEWMSTQAQGDLEDEG